jgi:outer membrane murein-binding lipoprotein Lpp
MSVFSAGFDLLLSRTGHCVAGQPDDFDSTTINSDYWSKPLHLFNELHDELVGLAPQEFADSDNPELIELHTGSSELLTLQYGLNAQDEQFVESWTTPGAVTAHINTLKLETSNQKWLGRLSVLLGTSLRVSVFLPIYIAWEHLSRAGRAYGEAIAVDPGLADIPFLALWQQGFDGQAQTGSLFSDFTGDAARVVTAIVIIMALSALVDAVQTLLDDKTESKRQTALKIGGALERSLSQHQLNSALRFRSELTSAARSLRTLHTRAETLIESSNSTVDRFNSDVNRLTGDARDVAEKIDATNSELERYSVRLQDGFNSSITSFSQKIEETLEIIKDFQRQAATQKPNYVSELERGIQEASVAISQLKVAIEESKSHQRAGTSMSAMLVDALGERLNTSEEKQDELNKKFEEFSRRQSNDAAIDQIRKDIAALLESVNKLTSSVEQISNSPKPNPIIQS